MPRLGGNSDIRSGDCGDSPPLDILLTLTIAELFDDALLVTVPEVDGMVFTLSRGELLRIGNPGLLDRARGGSVLLAGPSNGSGLLARPRNGSGLLASARDGTGLLASIWDGPGLLDATREGPGLPDTVRDARVLMDRPRGASRYGAIGDTGEGGLSTPLETG